MSFNLAKVAQMTLKSLTVCANRLICCNRLGRSKKINLPNISDFPREEHLG